ncbi:hypothetical protein [Vibrio cyclitrophicus]|uniref:Uncharacterized protein n=1 Tax=Vibrio cyclitrophicus ZF270 TaxID=1136176 RepID=A0AAN0NB02_9VIBR|nr:hypothetical protein [Vibrio cyclitrophicus]ERM58179.1 hypothetical protein M565_ctg5P1150 [Vibrio cyclitrophicus FF75]
MRERSLTYIEDVHESAIRTFASDNKKGLASARPLSMSQAINPTTIITSLRHAPV